MLEFPSFLRGPVQANYSRNDGARFQASQPASGAYFAQIISDDVPSYFDVQFVFERQFAQAFRAWLRQNSFEILTGAQFEIDLSIEDGLSTQVGSFTPDGIPQCTGENANVITYSARIVVPRLYEPSAGFEDLILGVMNGGGSYQLQYLINEDLA